MHLKSVSKLSTRTVSPADYFLSDISLTTNSLNNVLVTPLEAKSERKACSLCFKDQREKDLFNSKSPFFPPPWFMIKAKLELNLFLFISTMQALKTEFLGSTSNKQFDMKRQGETNILILGIYGICRGTVCSYSQ